MLTTLFNHNTISTFSFNSCKVKMPVFNPTNLFEWFFATFSPVSESAGKIFDGSVTKVAQTFDLVASATFRPESTCFGFRSIKNRKVQRTDFILFGAIDNIIIGLIPVVLGNQRRSVFELYFLSPQIFFSGTTHCETTLTTCFCRCASVLISWKSETEAIKPKKLHFDFHPEAKHDLRHIATKLIAHAIFGRDQNFISRI